MKLIFHVLNLYKINEIIILLSLVLFGLLIYFFTTYFLKYIPQELISTNIFKFRKAK